MTCFAEFNGCNVISNNKFFVLPLQNMESSHKQNGHSRITGKENRKTSRKRGHSVTVTDYIVSKRLRIDNKASDLQDKSKKDLSDDACQIDQYLIPFMYRLDLSVLCSIRKSIYEHKYPLLSLAFEDYEIDKFNNVVLHYGEKSIYIQIENVDKYYTDDVNYAKLFTKKKRMFSINNYFDSFLKYILPKSDSLLNNIEYLVIYTNADLDLTEEKKLRKGRTKNFYPFKFDCMEKCNILKDFLFTNDSAEGQDFYQFSQDKTTKEELLKQLEFSFAAQKLIKKRKFSQKFENEIKENFLNKLVFVVNQPNREELNSIIKNEIKGYCVVQDDYIVLQKEILCDLMTSGKDENTELGIIYEFNVLMSFLHGMILDKNIFFINFENHDIPRGITVHYKDKITYIKAYNTNSNIGYSQLFPSRKHEKENLFSINKCFTLFFEKLEKDKNIEYFIIYTNAGLNLTEERELKKGQSKDFYPLKFNKINIRKKKNEILRDCSCINKNDLYQFAQEEATRAKLLSLLKLSPSLQKEERFSDKNDKEIKEKFLDHLIFAVSQPNKGNEIEKANRSKKVLCNYEELHEIALRWSESHEFGPITKEIMKKLLKDIRSNKSSYQKIQNKNIHEKIKFAKSVVGKKGTPAFNKFLDFLIREERLEILKRNGINPANTSSILSRAGVKAPAAFKDLYDLWFNEEETKTKYLTTLEEECINLSNMSSILSRAGPKASEAFKNLFDL